MKRQACNAQESQAAWLRRRRAAVATGVAEALRAGDDLTFDEDEAINLSVWSDQHQSELEFQQQKQKKMQLESYNRKTLLGKEVTPALVEEAAERRRKDEKNDKDLIKGRREKTRAMERMHQTMSWELLAGQAFYVEESLPPEIALRLSTFNMSPAKEAVEAMVFIVKDAANPPVKVQWLARLLGRLVLDSTVVTQSSGMMVQFRPAIKTAIALHTTAAFRAKYPGISEVITTSVNHQGRSGRWRIVRLSAADAVLGTSEEAAAHIDQDDRWYNKCLFLDAISKLDLKKSGKCSGS